jgi:hypothetical protein
MADKTSNANLFMGNPQGRITAATEIGLNAWKPIFHLQVVMLRMWADSIERLAGDYQRGVDEVTTTVRKQSDEEHAA